MSSVTTRVLLIESITKQLYISASYYTIVTIETVELRYSEGFSTISTIDNCWFIVVQAFALPFAPLLLWSPTAVTVYSEHRI